MTEHRSILSWLSADIAGEEDAVLMQSVECSICKQQHKPSLSVPVDGKEVCPDCKVNNFLSQVKTKDGKPAKLGPKLRGEVNKWR